MLDSDEVHHSKKKIMKKLLDGMSFLVEVGSHGGCFYDSAYPDDDPVAICEWDSSSDCVLNEILAFYGKPHIELPKEYSRDSVQIVMNSIVKLGGVIENKVYG